MAVKTRHSINPFIESNSQYLFYIPDIYIMNDRTKQDRAVVNQEER
jgi:hypothetical protein